MHSVIILKILGILLMLYSLTMLPPVCVGLYFEDGAVGAFLVAFLVILILGLLCWLPVHRRVQEVRTRDGFMIVVMFWVVLGLCGALPLIWFEDSPFDITDAIFESISGLTTTGATVLTQIEGLPHAVLYYRQQLQWLGGMGIIVLAVAVLPMLGIGGMQLYRAETPGPIKDSKLTPRITETAKALWYIYVTLTAVCALAYWASGMSLFDAVGHSYATVAIGGFSTHDNSIGYFDSALIDAICCLFMFISSINFALHFFAWKHQSVRHYFSDSEFKFHCFILLVIAIITCTHLLLQTTYNDPIDAIRFGIFQTLSITTTTGFATENFAYWPVLVSTILLFGSFMGGCAGSTCGGMKGIRVLLMYKQGVRELKRLIYPSAFVALKLGDKAVSDRVIEAVWGFVSAYIAVFIILLLCVLATGLDLTTGFSAVAGCLNNLGPGLGKVANHYGDISDPTKWILCFAMIIGRLEILTFLVLFNPVFWRY